MRFISTDQIQEGMVLSKNIYDSSFKLLLRAGNTLSDKYIKRIHDLGYQGIYITDDISLDIDVQDVIVDQLRVDAFLTVREVCYHAYNYSKNHSKHAHEVETKYVALQKLTDKLIHDLKKRNIERINLIDLKIFEDYIASHCVNVGVLALFLGIALDLSYLELQRLGVAALLHDVGKMFLDPRILNKNGRLTDKEMKYVNQHVNHSYTYAKESINMHTSSYLGILYHHERVDGTGYPKGKHGNEIPLFSKIISICDVYDALTSNRPNRPPLLPNEATEYMMANGSSMFDHEILQVFIKKIAPYPKGIEIQLSNGQRGIVVENQKDLSLRPTVRVFMDAEGHNIQPYLVELSDVVKYRNLTITEVLHTKAHV